MKRRENIKLMQAVMVGVCMALSSAFAFADVLSVELLLDPNNPVIDLAAPGAVTIIARPSREDVTFHWKHDGIGRLDGGEGDPGRQYIPPQDIKGDMTQTTISVTVTDKDGKSATASVTFTLKKTPPATPTPTAIPTDTPTPMPTATPTEIPTATPTETPTLTPTATPTEIPAQTATPTPAPTATPTEPPAPKETELERLSREADACFAQKKYLTPAKDNAFDRYKRILQLDPEHRQARRNLRAMAEQYKTWGDDRFQRGEKEKAKQSYENYLTVADYLISGGAFEQNEQYEAVKRRLDEIARPVDDKTRLSCQPTTAGLDELLQAALPNSLKVYQQFKAQETRGEAENADVVWAIRAVLCHLIAIEDILQQEYQASADPDVLKSIQRIQATYQTYKQEFDQRDSKGGK